MSHAGCDATQPRRQNRLPCPPLPPLPSAGPVRGLLARTDTFVAGLKWHETGRLDIALGRAMPVRCLCTDARGYGMITDNRDRLGHDAIIVTTVQTVDDVWQTLPPLIGFLSITKSDPIVIHHAGQPVQTLQVYLGRSLRWGLR